MRTILLFLLATALLACGLTESDPPGVDACPAGRPWDVRIHPDLSPKWQEGCVKAMERWQQVLGSVLLYSVRVTADAIPHGHYPPEQCAVSFLAGGTDPGTWGGTMVWSTAKNDFIGASVHLSTDTGLEGMEYATCLHEVGHVLRLYPDGPKGHNVDRTDRSVMWPVMTVPGRLGCSDVKEACRIYGCTPPDCQKGTWLDE